VDALIVVAEPGMRSLETARVVKRLCADLGLKKVYVVGNKIRSEADKEFIAQNVDGLPVLGNIPYADSIVDSDRLGVSVFEKSPEAVAAGREIFKKLTG
jgi:CO dehydrogenase maturation factor